MSNVGIISEDSFRGSSLLQIAKQMVISARTAPKTKGLNFLETLIIDGEDIQVIADKMFEIGAKTNTSPAFLRDAKNILSAHVIVLLGTRIGSVGLTYCSLCGFENCAEKNNHINHPCAFNTTDLGIATGSAVSMAMDARVDNRIMYTVGMAVSELGFMTSDVKIIYGIPLSASSKNVFFDRK